MNETIKKKHINKRNTKKNLVNLGSKPILKIIYEGFVARFPNAPIAEYEENQKVHLDKTLFQNIPEIIRQCLMKPEFLGSIPSSGGMVSPSHFYRIQLPRSGRNVSICIWPDSMDHIKISNRVSKWLYYLDQTFPISPKCSKNLTVYLFLTDYKKKIPGYKESCGTLEEIHINSAFTYSCMENNQIIIFRKEEWFKVFMHETMHALGMDFSHIDNTKITSKLIHACFGGVESKDLRIYESYSEFWAEIFHILFLVYERFEKSNYDSFIHKKVSRMIQNEKEWSCIQANKILKYYSISYRPDLFIPNDRAGPNYIEMNNVAIFSYYILKCILYLNLENMLKWCQDHNMAPYVKFEVNHIESFIDHICKWAKSINIPRKQIKNSSLRMSSPKNEASM